MVGSGLFRGQLGFGIRTEELSLETRKQAKVDNPLL